MASRSSPHVLIAGAGLGGLTLAQALRKQGISCEVFERDHEGTSRPQGAAISLHSMLDDLRSSTLDDLPPLETVDHLLPLDLATDFAIFTAGQPGKIGVRDDGSHRFIRANRARLRAWLATKVSVRYGKRAVRFAEEEKRVTVYFEDGTSATGDILVGADGANSALRKHLLQGPDPLRREPVGVVGGEVTVRGAALAQQLSLAHSAYVVESGPADAAAAPWRYFVGLKDVAPDGASARYYFYVMWPDAEAAAAAGAGNHWTQTADGRQMLDFARDRVGRLGDPVFGVLPDLAGPGDMMVPPLHFSTLLLDALPAGRVTLLGDAAHAMTPFRGEGGCHAMQDALNLARALARIDFDDDANIRQVLGEYQKEMLERGAHAAALSSEAFPYQTMTQSIMLWGEKLEPLDEEKVICSEIPRVSDEVYARLQSV